MRLEVRALGLDFQNPILLAAGTCGFGLELEDVVDLERLGGFVTKSVTVEPRSGNPPPRVTEFVGGMMNSVGLANPGLERVKREKLPWLAEHVVRPKVFVSVAGHTVDEFVTLVDELDECDGFDGFEINLSCPNDARRDAPPFALDPEAVHEIISRCRAATSRPLVAKLAPNDHAIGSTASLAIGAGADGLTLANTTPGLLLSEASGQAELGAGGGGVSGPAVRPSGIRAVRAARETVDQPIMGVGGVLGARDAVGYARAGANLVQVGTATFALPTAAIRLISDLERWGRRHGVGAWEELVTKKGTQS